MGSALKQSHTCKNSIHIMKKSFKINAAWLYIFTGILFGLIIKLFVIDVLHVSGNSMEPAFKDGDSVIVQKFAYGIPKPFRGTFFVQWAEPKLNDIVIFLHDNKIVVKRCVAVSGEQLDFSSNSEYILNIRGRKISLTRTQFERLSKFSRVPEGFILAIGDNLSESIDSRDYGFVSVKNIVGKIIER